MKSAQKFYGLIAQRDRLDRYDISRHQHDPERTGLLPSAPDYELATASLGRNETISLFGSNSFTNERLLLKLKWRPAGTLVTLASRLEFSSSEGRTYVFEQLETYAPQALHLALGAASKRPIINQYGSSGSQLKLIVLNPYRRLRIVFGGLVREVAGNQELVFMRLGCVLTPCGQIFDFLSKSASFSMRGKRNTGLAQLAHHDRHEQKVRFDGEFSLAATKGRLLLKGFHVRHLFELGSPALDANYNTSRLYVSLRNGKSLQIGVSSWRDEPKEASSTEPQEARTLFGYTHFLLQPTCATLKDFGQASFECVRHRKRLLEKPLVVRSQQGDERLEFKLTELGPQSNWFLVEARSSLAKQKEEEEAASTVAPSLPGWAFWTQDDEMVDSAQTVEAMRANREERERALKEGELCSSFGLPQAIGLKADLLVVSLDDSFCVSSELVGSKAASLAQLLRFEPKCKPAAYRVPQAFVLTRYACELIAQANGRVQEQLVELTNGLDQGELVRERCAQLVALVRETELPEELMAQLVDKLRCANLTETRLAVRSSSWAEDEADMSAAGQLQSQLDVPFSAARQDDTRPLKCAILACFASRFSYENVQYRRQHGLPLDLPMAVLVQEMVACEKAGVMFTCNPITGNPCELLVTANFGLGESVVSAAADPDSISVAVDASHEPAQLSIREIRVGKKEQLVAPVGRGTSAAASGDRSSCCCLSEREILELAQVGQKLERFYSNRQRHCDIEFGFLGGQLHLFQCRPVTGLESYTHEELLHEFDRTGQSELVFYTRANVGEVLPYAIRPLSLTLLTTGHWSVMGAQMHLDFQPAAEWLPAEQIHVAQCVRADLACEKYHIFLNLFGGSFLRLADQQKTTISRSCEIGMFGREMPHQRDLVEASHCFLPAPNPFTGARFRLKTMRLRLNPTAHIEAIKRRIEKRYRRLLAEFEAPTWRPSYELHEERRAAKLMALYERLKASLKENYIVWRIHLTASILDSEFHLELKKLLAKYIESPSKLSAAANEFLAQSKGVISAEIPQRIQKIAQLIKSSCAGPAEDGAQRFLEMSETEALEYLRNQSEFVEFINKFGHRCYAEFDVASSTWREQPEQLLEMLRTNCRSSSSSSSSNGAPEVATTKSGKSIEQVISSLGLSPKLNKLDRLRLKHLLVPRCQLFLASRERTKNTIILFIGCIRLVALLLAREMRAQMRLPDQQLLFFVPFDELELLCRDFRPAIVSQALKRRQLFERHFPPNEPWKFDEIVRSPELLPNHLRHDQALDERLKRAPKLEGTPASSGKARGRVCLVRNYTELARVEPGTILLTHSTDIAFSPVFPLVAGIITEVGGLISHGAVVAREYGLPSVIGIPNVTRILEHGEQILLDADNGTIIRLEAGSSSSSSNQRQETTTTA